MDIFVNYKNTQCNNKCFNINFSKQFKKVFAEFIIYIFCKLH